MPASGSLLHLPEPPILTSQIKADGGVPVAPHNASDGVRAASVASALLSLRHAWRRDSFGQQEEEPTVQYGMVTLDLPPRRPFTLHLDLSGGSA